ncbi:hypothetical protein ACWCOV_36810 [Kribbella sp. NPDC002412]
MADKTEESHQGETLETTEHDTIKDWAERRGAKPTVVEGTEEGAGAGVLRLDFPGYGGDNLREVSWDEWFETFDRSGLKVVYQEHKVDGEDSNFIKLVKADD